MVNKTMEMENLINAIMEEEFNGNITSCECERAVLKVVRKLSKPNKEGGQ